MTEIYFHRKHPSSPRMRGSSSNLIQIILGALLAMACESDTQDWDTNSSMDSDSDIDSDSDGDSDSDSDSDSDTDSLGGACEFEEKLGSFEVAVYDSYSFVTGSMADAVSPSNIPEVAFEDGNCTLYRNVAYECDPQCEPNWICNSSEECVPYPTNQDLGTISISGLAEDVEMEPAGVSFDYFNTTLPHPVFSSDADITLTSTNGYAGELLLKGYGVALLEPLDETWTVEAGSKLVVNYGEPGGDPRAEIVLDLTVDQHGISPVYLRCSGEDTGELTVSSAMVDALLEAGISGMANGSITRRTVDSTQVAGGCLEFSVLSFQKPTVDII